jgi:membrane protease YdiL (CAAX protease family)
VRSLALLGLVVGLLVVSAVASPWVTWWVSALFHKPFTLSRVYNRVFEVLLIGGLLLAWRRLDLGGPRDIGLASRDWAPQLWRGLGIGLIGVGIGLTVCWLLGGLVPDLRYPGLKTVRKALLGAGAAVLIGVGEEALFRGVLLRRLMRDFGKIAGIATTTAIYAVVHTIGHSRWRGQVTPWSGVEHTLALFAPVARPEELPALIGLTLLGLLLVAARLRTGSLWTPIGIHAAWVAAFRVGRLFFDILPGPAWLVGSGWPPLIGGATGWIALAVTAALLLRRR